jgi:hypothetical protein
VTLPFVFLLLDYWPLRRVTGDKKPVGKLSTLNPSASTFGCGATAPTQAAPEASPRRERSEGGQLSTLLLEKWPFFGIRLTEHV